MALTRPVIHGHLWILYFECNKFFPVLKCQIAFRSLFWAYTKIDSCDCLTLTFERSVSMLSFQFHMDSCFLKTLPPWWVLDVKEQGKANTNTLQNSKMETHKSAFSYNVIITSVDWNRLLRSSAPKQTNRDDFKGLYCVMVVSHRRQMGFPDHIPHCIIAYVWITVL